MEGRKESSTSPYSGFLKTLCRFLKYHLNLCKGFQRWAQGMTAFPRGVRRLGNESEFRPSSSNLSASCGRRNDHVAVGRGNRVVKGALDGVEVLERPDSAFIPRKRGVKASVYTVTFTHLGGDPPGFALCEVLPVLPEMKWSRVHADGSRRHRKSPTKPACLGVSGSAHHTTSAGNQSYLF